MSGNSKPKCTYLEPTFICTSCNKTRDHDIREKGRNRCLICSNHKKNLKSSKPKSFNEYELNYWDFKRLQALGMFKCSSCLMELEQSLNDRNKGKCRPCNLESKRLDRMVKAEVVGRVFKSNTLHSAHIKAMHNYYNHNQHVIELNQYTKDPELFMSQKKAKKGLPDGLHNYYSEIGKPWLSPYVELKDRWKIRYKSDIDFKLRELLQSGKNKNVKRRTMRKVIMGQHSGYNLEQQFGFTLEQFKLHLESLFTGDMSWEAMMNGEIHLDHVIPIEAFDETNINHARYCWSLANLQPLWAKDNMIKSDRLINGERAKAYVLKHGRGAMNRLLNDLYGINLL